LDAAIPDNAGVETGQMQRRMEDVLPEKIGNSLLMQKNGLRAIHF
jgi:hypothetical protein